MLICGAASASAYTGRDGKPRASLEVTAEDVEFLSAMGHDAQAAQAEPAQQHDTEGGFTAVETEDLPF